MMKGREKGRREEKNEEKSEDRGFDSRFIFREGVMYIHVSVCI